MSLRITLSANAGVALELGGHRLWVDALHDTPAPGFSAVTPALVQQLWTAEPFREPEALVFTHCHGDHYSRALAEEALVRWPRARAFLPQQELPGQTLLRGDELAAEVGDLRLRFFALPHEGEDAVAHYGLTASDGRCTVLIAGDCAVASPVLAQRLQSEKVDVALLDFPWVTSPKGRAFIAGHIHPDHLVVYHLPFPGEGNGRYAGAVGRCLPRIRGCGQVHILESFLQTLTL